MSLEGLPTPVLGRIISHLDQSSPSAVLSLVCKSLCARINTVSRLRLPVDENLEQTRQRCLKRHFQPDQLHLVAIAPQQLPTFPQLTSLNGLFQLPNWTHLHTLRVRDFNLPEEVLHLLPQACPHLTELFLEGITPSSTPNSSCSSSGSHAYLSVPVTVPLSKSQACSSSSRSSSTINAPTGVLWCNISVPALPADQGSDVQAPARIACTLSKLSQLRVLRMDSPLAKGVMLHLCQLLGRPCTTDGGDGGSSSSSNHHSHSGGVSGLHGISDQPVLVHMPLLGWYLFNVTGPAACSSSGSSGFNRASSSQSSSTHTEANSDAELAAAAAGSSRSLAAAAIGTSSSIPSSGPAGTSSSPGSSSSSSQQSGAAASAAAQLAEDPSLPVQLPGGGTIAAAASLARSSSIGRRSLDLQRSLDSLSTHTCKCCCLGANGSCSSDGSGSSLESGCCTCSCCCCACDCCTGGLNPSNSTPAVVDSTPRGPLPTCALGDDGNGQQ